MTNVLAQEITDRYAIYHADCVDVLAMLPDNSVHFSVFSPPFASLYTYSASPRDMGNVASHAEFHEQHMFMLRELFRVLKPGRLASIHCMQLPTSKMRDGFIGLSDFRGQLVRACQEVGFVFHSEVAIWKDPVQAMQRTKALGLLHKQIRKDSAMSRQGINDYLITMRKPGVNAEPISHTDETFPVDLWQRYASPVWATIEDHASTLSTGFHGAKVDNPRAALSGICRDDMGRAMTLGPDINPSDTLQFRSAREADDEKHICPLQLEVIRRAILLWSNPGDVVLSPFAGIGSEGHVALHEGRAFIGAELKASYFEMARQNLARAAGNPAPITAVQKQAQTMTGGGTQSQSQSGPAGAQHQKQSAPAGAGTSTQTQEQRTPAEVFEW